MAAAGQDAVAEAEAVYTKGGYVLAVEGGIPHRLWGQCLLCLDLQRHGDYL